MTSNEINAHLLVSFVVPCLNVEDTIVNTLDSILSIPPTYPYEVIVVDNGSTDGTASLLKKYSAHFLSEPRRGRSFARNLGLSVARGKYVAFVDADTVLSPDWLEKIVPYFEMYGVVGVQARLILKAKSGGLLEQFRSFQTNERGKRRTDLTRTPAPFLDTAACIYDRQFLIEHAISFDPFLDRPEDMDFSWQCLGHGAGLAFSDAEAEVWLEKKIGIFSHLKRYFQQGLSDRVCAEKWFSNQPQILGRMHARLSKLVQPIALLSLSLSCAFRLGFGLKSFQAKFGPLYQGKTLLSKGIPKKEYIVYSGQSARVGRWPIEKPNVDNAVLLDNSGVRFYTAAKQGMLDQLYRELSYETGTPIEEIESDGKKFLLSLEKALESS